MAKLRRFTALGEERKANKKAKPKAKKIDTKDKKKKEITEKVYAPEEYEYRDATNYFWIHQDDSDLKPIKFNVDYIIRKNYRFWNPEGKGEQKIASPHPKKIANWGLPKCEQYFRREVYPKRLEVLEKRFGGLQNEIWLYLDAHQSEYKEEIAFINKQWYHLLFGYWFYNNGVPTYIDGWHWLHLNYTTGSYESIDRLTLKKVITEYPEYRDRDRRKFLVWKYSLVDTMHFRDYDAEGYAIPNEDGEYDMVDTGKRLWFGTIYPKHRRDGATTNILTIIYAISISLLNGYSSMIANRDKTGEEHFQKKLIPAWRKFKFFFRPIHDGSDRPKRAINFVSPAAKSLEKRAENAMIDVLDTVIDYADVADRIYYDGNKITGGLLLDEEGKTLAVDIYKGWDIVKPAMSQGAGSTINPYALAFHPSTVEEMEGGGGQNYLKLTEDSDYYQRNTLTGMTRSGLFYFFLPAYDGLENFIGPYGESIIDDPTAEQARFIGKKYGAKEHIRKTIESISMSDDPSAKDKLDSFVRKHPIRFADCWMMRGGDLGFDQKKLDLAIDRLKKDKSAVVKGSFYWEIPGYGCLSAEQFLNRPRMAGSDIDSLGKVIFEPDSGGKFFVSKTVANSSLRERDALEGHWRPIHPDVFIASADPVMYNLDGQSKMRADKSKTSFPAGVVFWNMQQEEMEKELEEIESHRFVCSYCHKTNDEDVYLEEMLMMCVYYGSMMYPETNIRSVVKWFTDRGYGGYLKYDYDEVNGKYSTRPGFNTSSSAGGGVKDELFTEIKNHIYRHVHREKHLDIIMQWKLIKKKEEMTKYDLIPCTGGALRGLKYSPRFIDFSYGKSKDAQNDDFDLSDYFGNTI
jgi:hypothetical protein